MYVNWIKVPELVSNRVQRTSGRIRATPENSDSFEVIDIRFGKHPSPRCVETNIVDVIDREGFVVEPALVRVDEVRINLPGGVKLAERLAAFGQVPVPDQPKRPRSEIPTCLGPHFGATAHPAVSSLYSFRFPWFVPEFTTAAPKSLSRFLRWNPRHEYSFRRSVPEGLAFAFSGRRGSG